MACMLVNASLICINVSVHSFTRKLGMYKYICENGKARITQDQKKKYVTCPPSFISCKKVENVTKFMS